MICAEHVDQGIKATGQLIVVIRDIRREIGPAAVRLHDRAVNIIAVVRGFEQRLFARFPIFGQLAFGRLKRAAIDQTLAFQIVNRCFDAACAVKRLLGKEVVHSHVQTRQIFADQVHHLIGRKSAYFFQPDVFWLIDVFITDHVFQRFADRYKVIARIGAVREFNIPTVRLEVAQVHRPCEDIDLRTAVVDVVFARNVVACELQKRRQSIPENRAACVTDMQRTRRIGRHVFDIHLLTRAHIRAAVVGALIQNRFGHVLPDRPMQTQVDEPRPRHFGSGDTVVCSKLGHQCISDIAWLLAGGFGQHHCSVRRHVTVQRIARRLDRDRSKVQPLGEAAFFLHFFNRGQHQAADLGKEVHVVSSHHSARVLTRHPVRSTTRRLSALRAADQTPPTGRYWCPEASCRVLENARRPAIRTRR